MSRSQLLQETELPTGLNETLYLWGNRALPCGAQLILCAFFQTPLPSASSVTSQFQSRQNERKVNQSEEWLGAESLVEDALGISEDTALFCLLEKVFVIHGSPLTVYVFKITPHLSFLLPRLCHQSWQILHMELRTFPCLEPLEFVFTIAWCRDSGKHKSSLPWLISKVREWPPLAAEATVPILPSKGWGTNLSFVPSKWASHRFWGPTMLRLILGHLLLEMWPWSNYTAFPYLWFLICSSGIHIHFVKIPSEASLACVLHAQ